MSSRDYHSHVSQVYRTPSVVTDVPRYPNAHVAFNKKVVYEVDEEPHHHHHQFRHPTPDERERVEVVEYEQADNYGNTEVVYEENVDVENNQHYPRRNRGGFDLYKWKTFRQ